MGQDLGGSLSVLGDTVFPSQEATVDLVLDILEAGGLFTLTLLALSLGLLSCLVGSPNVSIWVPNVRELLVTGQGETWPYCPPSHGQKGQGYCMAFE